MLQQHKQCVVYAIFLIDYNSEFVCSQILFSEKRMIWMPIAHIASFSWRVTASANDTVFDINISYINEYKIRRENKAMKQLAYVLIAYTGFISAVNNVALRQQNIPSCATDIRRTKHKIRLRLNSIMIHRTFINDPS